MATTFLLGNTPAMADALAPGYALKYARTLTTATRSLAASFGAGTPELESMNRQCVWNAPHGDHSAAYAIGELTIGRSCGHELGTYKACAFHMGQIRAHMYGLDESRLCQECGLDECARVIRTRLTHPARP